METYFVFIYDKNGRQTDIQKVRSANMNNLRKRLVKEGKIERYAQIDKAKHPSGIVSMGTIYRLSDGSGYRYVPWENDGTYYRVNANGTLRKE